MKKHPLHKYIYKIKNQNTYIITKSINNKMKFFGSFKNIDEAIKYRDKLQKNNWKPLPETPEEKEQRLSKEYYKHIQRHNKKTSYIIRNNNNKYIGSTKSIEKALYYRDLYFNNPPEKCPPLKEVDLPTNNPYLKNGLKYELPERLILPPKNTGYGKGSIVKKGETSYHLHHGKKGNGFNSYICSCVTYEQAYYVRLKLNEANWNLDELPRILEEYPLWYTELLYFYQYIGKRRVYNRSRKDEKVYRGWDITIPKEFLDNNRSLQKIGPYTNIEDALFERDFLKKHNWDYTLLVETINDNDNPYYDMELPPYPQRKIRNLADRDYHEKELHEIIEHYKNGITSQGEISELLGITEVTIRNWLKKWNTNWREFTGLIDNGEDPLSVLEKKVHILQPDLSRALPNNFTDNIHQLKSGKFQVMRRTVYYGVYPSKELAKSVVKGLKKVDWDKSKLKSIHDKLGYTSPVMSKKWVYKQGRKWAVRRKDKNKKFITYGSWHDKRIAELVRDMLLMYGFKLENMSWIEDIAVMTVKMLDVFNNTMFGRVTIEDIMYVETE